MPNSKLNGPCSVQGCTNTSSEFRRLTKRALEQASALQTLTQYPYLQLQQEICYLHYMQIVENSGSKRRKLHDEATEEPVLGELLE
jgi:hypothetical protein